MTFYIHHDRITTAYNGDIANALFEFFYSDSGAAIKIESSGYSLFVVSSFFRSCVSTSHGGAILLRGKSSSLDRSCFESCYRYGTSDNVWGNAICSRLYSSSTGTATVNTSTFSGCGPFESSGDSAAFFDQHSLKSENVNFSKCSGYGGSASITISGKPGDAKFMSVCNGYSWLITDIYQETKLYMEKVNFINWTQTKDKNVFGDFKTEITDCCLFIIKRIGSLGPVTFKGNCYGNVNFQGLINTQPTEIIIPKLDANKYCQYKQFCKDNPTHQKNPQILRVFTFPLLGIGNTLMHHNNNNHYLLHFACADRERHKISLTKEMNKSSILTNKP